MTAWMDAAMWSVYRWHGVEPGQAHVRFWGTPVRAGKRAQAAFKNLVLHRRTIGAFDLSAQNVSSDFEMVRGLEPHYGYGYPTLMRAFVDLCQRADLDGRVLGLKVVITTGEILSPAARDEISRFFGCPVVNEYGCTESGILGFECEFGTMHSVPVAAWPEVLGHEESEGMRGQEDEIVVTDLYGTTMPLLRYRLHDRGTQSFQECSCGRDLPKLSITSGRSDSFIETPNGKKYDAILAYTVPKGVQRFKVFQVGPDRLEAQVVAAAGYAEEEIADACKNLWETALGSGMTVEVQTVDSIPLEPSGKLRYFVPLSEFQSGS